MGLMQLVAYGAQDIYFGGNIIPLKKCNVIVENSKGGFRIKSVSVYSHRTGIIEYDKTKNICDLEKLSGIFYNKTLIYVHDSLEDLSFNAQETNFKLI